METKFTPGPWVARQEYANRWAIEAPSDGFVPLGIGHVSTTVLEVGSNDKATAANARLIAAAPELLDALRRAVLALAFSAETSPAMRDDYNAVSAAIAKATGA